MGGSSCFSARGGGMGESSCFSLMLSFADAVFLCLSFFVCLCQQKLFFADAVFR